jgi:predicted nucleotidyltransferase
MSQIEQYQQIIVPVLKKYMIKRAAIFGSFAKNESHANSDLDILIEPGRGFTIFKFLELEEEIATLINRKVDLVEFSAIKTSIRKEVLATAIAML